jgi:hypothetical protein
MSTTIGGYKNYSGKTSDCNYTNGRGYGRSENRYGIHNSFIISGNYNIASANSGGAIISGSNTKLVNTCESLIISSRNSNIYAQGCYAPLGYQSCNSVINSFMLSSYGSCFFNTSSTYYAPTNYNCPVKVKNSGIISGVSNRIKTYGWITGAPLPSGTYVRSQVILGGSSLDTGVESYGNTIYNYSITVQNLFATCKIIGMTGSTSCCGWTGTLSNPSFICIVNGLVTCVG